MLIENPNVFIKNILIRVFEKLINDFFKKAFQFLTKRINPYDVDEDTMIIDVDSSELDNNDCDPLLLKTLSQRFEDVIRMMNQVFSTKRYSISILAEAMGLESSRDLYKYVNGLEEPSFVFMNTFCQCFGVNSNWLKNGNLAPFASEETYNLFALDYFKRIKEVNPDTIFFIRSKSDIGQTGIVLKVNEFKYIYFPKIYHISSNVGATGMQQILSFYQLIRTIEEANLSSKCSGIRVTEDVFDDIFCGRVFPGVIKSLDNVQNHWWDDFTDVYHQYPIAKNYEEWYGKEFILAQEIVRSFLDQRPKSFIF